MRRPSRRSAWRWLLFIGLVLLVSSPALAAHCPSPDPQGDCPKAVDTWWIKFFMPILGAFLGGLSAVGNWFSGPWLASPGYAQEAPPAEREPTTKPEAAIKQRFATDADPPEKHEIYTKEHGTPVTVSEQEWDKQMEAWGLKGNAKPVPGKGPTDTYNCNGYTFCGGEAWLTDWKQVEAILTDNKYQEVRKNERKQKGDVAVYKGTWTDNDGKVYKNAVVHTGVVMEVGDDGQPTKVRSKWGQMSLYEHGPEDVYVYKTLDGVHVEYHRSPRPGGNRLRNLSVK